MKIKFNPEIAYFAGFWKTRKTREGIGISGDAEAQQIFISEAMNALGIPPQKIQVKDKKVFFYHSAYRKYLEKMVEDELDIFKWRNKFALKFIAGIFDGCGGVDEKLGAVYFAKATDADQLVMERLGIITKRIGGKLYISAKHIPLFIEHFAGTIKREELKSRLLALMRSGNERDPR